MNNIPTLTVDNAVKEISKIYTATINETLSAKSIPSIMLYGAPGIGKSSAIKQVAEIVEKETGKICEVVDVRLNIMSPVDLLGLPVPDLKNKEASYLVPQMFNLKDDKDKVYIVFFDELNTCSPAMMAAAYQLILDRKCGGFEFPENVFVVAAGNRQSDHSISFKLSAALANRMIHIEIGASHESWHRYAVSKGFSHYVMGFLDFDQSKLNVETDKLSSDEVAFPTSRSWEFVSTLLNTLKCEPKDIHHFIAGSIGETTALQFEKYCQIYSKLPDIDKIFKGEVENIVLPKGQDILFALIGCLVDRILKNHRELMDNEIENAMKFVMKHTPMDFTAKFYFDITLNEEVKVRVSRFPAYIDWWNKNRARV